LAAILGSQANVFCAGELSYLPGQGWSGADYCSCGARGDDCDLWNQIRGNWANRLGTDDIREYHRLTSHIEHSRSAIRRLGNLGQRPWPEFDRYAQKTRAVFEAIRHVTSSATIVDSSKLRSRALALSRIPGIDLRVIHLIRDVRGVVWSKKKKLCAAPGVTQERSGQRAWRTVAGWIQNHFQSQRVLRALGPGQSVQLRYEDLVTDPVKSLRDLEAVTESDSSSIGRQLAAAVPIVVGHVIAGNRMRLAGSLRLKPDTEWRHALPGVDRCICWVLAGWLLRRYGYRRSPEGHGEVPAAVPRVA
jgi:hypothetical protein